jgi:hypothetical protein
MEGTVHAQLKTDAEGRVESETAKGHPLFVAEVERAIHSIRLSECREQSFEIGVDFKFDDRMAVGSAATVRVVEPDHFTVSAPAPTVTYTTLDPAVVTIGELFREADVVAIIRILPGESEMEVLSGFKGARAGEKLGFTRYSNTSIGAEYLVFLRRPHGGEPGYVGMYQGYGVMPVDQVCAFAGRDKNRGCDSGVEIDTYQVRLPKRIRTYPSQSENGNKKWVKRSALVTPSVQPGG